MMGPDRQPSEEQTHPPEREMATQSAESPALTKLVLRPQEIPLDDPQSKYLFQPSPAKPFVATPAALQRFGQDMIVACLQMLQRKAAEHNGVDYLQVFEDPNGRRLWFMEDDEGGAITALLPSDY